MTPHQLASHDIEVDAMTENPEVFSAKKRPFKLSLAKAVIAGYSKPYLKVHIYNILRQFLTFANVYTLLVINVSRSLATEVDRSSWL